MYTMPVETECIDCWLSMALFSLCKHLTATIDLTSYATASVLAVPPSTTQAFFKMGLFESCPNYLRADNIYVCIRAVSQRVF